MYWLLLKLGTAAALVVLPWKLWLLLLRFLYYSCTIRFDRHVLSRAGIPLHIPRTPLEILENKPRFFNLAQQNKIVPKVTCAKDINTSDLFTGFYFLKYGQSARLVDIKVSQEIEAEPDKAKTSVALRISFVEGEQEKSQDVFVKSQSGTGMPLWLQALRAAAEPGVAREVDFYNRISQKVPLAVPRVFVASKIPRYNVVCIVLEQFNLGSDGDLCVIPDHAFNSVEKVTAMLEQVAAMHGKYLGKTKSAAATKWIPAQEGLKLCEWIRTLGMKDEGKAYLAVYKAIERYFAKHPLTLLHGDCRPGNMIFSKKNDADVIFADWEAVNVGPPVWDFTYATVIGLPPQLRRDNHQKLLDSYLASLRKHVHEEGKQLLRTPEDYAKDISLLTLALFYLSRSVMKVQAWKNQGNTQKDLQNWKVRVVESVNDLDTKLLASLLAVPEADIIEVKSMATAYGKGKL